MKLERLSLLGLLTVVASLFLACSGPIDKRMNPQPSATSNAVPGGAGDLAYGFNVFMRGDAEGEAFNTKVIQRVEGAGFGWVRIPVYWQDVERVNDQWDPLPLDRVVNQLDAAGINILVTVSGAPDWARDPSGDSLLNDYADFGDFARFLAERYRGKIDAYEIWNEQNLASNMAGQVRLEDYCKLLEVGFHGVNDGDPNALVVFGGLTPTGVNDPSVALDDLEYLKEFYAYQDGAYAEFFDVLGIHVNNTNNPPDTMYPDNPGPDGWSDHPSFYFRRAEQLHDVMAEHGDQRPIWITEFGWTTENQAPGYEYGADNTAEEQADYLVRSFEIARTEWPWVTGMFVWNLNYSTVSPSEDEKYPWSVLEADWSTRPAYEALKEMPKE